MQCILGKSEALEQGGDMSVSPCTEEDNGDTKYGRNIPGRNILEVIFQKRISLRKFTLRPGKGEIRQKLKMSTKKITWIYFLFIITEH